MSDPVLIQIQDRAALITRELAAGLAATPREVVIATKASMRATANPGGVDTDQDRLAIDTGLGPQAASILAQPPL